MTALLYYSYSSGFSEVEKLAIDKCVFNNREYLLICLKRLPGKSKIILFSRAKNVDTIRLSQLPQAPIVRLYTGNTYSNFGRRGISIHGQKQDKVLFLRNRDLLPFVSMMNERFLRNQEVSKLIKKLRGGSWTNVLIYR